jgi:hypothetical protein
VNTKASTLTTFDRAALALDEAFVNDVCTACTVAGIPDHFSGSDTNNYPEVTVPTTPSGVVWDITVEGYVNFGWDTNDADALIIEIEQDVADADTFPTTLAAVVCGPPSVTATFGGCHFSGVVRGATAGSAYAFRIRADALTGTEDWTINSSALPLAYEQTSEIRAEVRPRTIF